MLILLQPGIQPLGQFDLHDGYTSDVVGGEVAAFEEVDSDETAAADVTRPGPPDVRLVPGLAGDPDSGDRVVWGLLDEGSSAGLGGRGYGTMFGQVIGATVGQGTGVGALSSSGVVVVGPSTVLGSGKATLWTKPGLYGVTQDAWVEEAFDGASINDSIYGQVLTGKLTTSAGGGRWVAYFIGPSSDTSFVSTPLYYAGVTPVASEFAALYLVGCS
jgi:hypothetical protein